jgi:peptidoglycan hydrolase CwlO-like protein
LKSSENKVKWEKIPTYIDYLGEEEMTTKEVESRLLGLEKSLEELQSAIRRIFQENNSNVSTLAKVSENLAKVQAEVATMKLEAEEKAKRDLKLGRTAY